MEHAQHADVAGLRHRLAEVALTLRGGTTTIFLRSIAMAH
jgi:hypothetical protein